MDNPKKYLIARILEFRKNKRRKLNVMPYRAASNSDVVGTESNSFKKGTEFEAFVVRRFDPECFTLIEWRSDKSVEDIFPIMSKFPDLEFHFENCGEQIYFAIECKWRGTLPTTGITLDKFHLENYRHYEEVTGNKTFIVLGIGNTPNQPNKVYIIPLKDIKRDTINEFELNVYQRKQPLDLFKFDFGKRILS